MRALSSVEDLKSRINQPVIPISAKEETGITDLEEKIREMFFSGEIDFNDEVYITNERHRQELLKAQESLSLVENSIESGMPEDFYSIDLTDAVKTFHKKIAHGNGCEVANVYKHFPQDRVFRQKHVGDMIQKHGKNCQIFNGIPGQSRLFCCWHDLLLLCRKIFRSFTSSAQYNTFILH